MHGELAVLVELRLPAASLQLPTALYEELLQLGLRIDLTFSPVPLRPATGSTRVSLDACHERLALVKGFIDNADLSGVSMPKIVRMYRDFAVSPMWRMGVDPSWSATHALSSIREHRDQCPIPPCDCDPDHPHGTIEDVIRYLGVEGIWREGVTGRNVSVAVVDGGVIAANRVPNGVFRPIPAARAGWPPANWGTISHWERHGNMVATSILSIAPDVDIFDVRISDEGTAASVIAGLEWAIKRYREDGSPRLLVNCWGIYSDVGYEEYAVDVHHPITRKIIEAIDEGMTVLFAAGNCGQCCPHKNCSDSSGPGKSIWGANGHPSVLTIGAVNKDEQLIGYSSQGPAALCDFKPDFCGISHFAGYSANDRGTSTACAVVAGIIALLLQSRPHLSSEALREILSSTAKDIGPPGWDRHSGFGIAHAQRAYEALVGRSVQRI
jgi:serine protease AprX